MVTISDFAMIVEDLSTGHGPEIETTDDDDDDGSSASDEINLLSEDCEDSLKLTEAYLENTAFMHGRTYTDDIKNEMAVMYANLSRGEGAKFNGVYIDTGRTPVFSYVIFPVQSILQRVPRSYSYEQSRQEEFERNWWRKQSNRNCNITCTIPRPEPRH